MENNSDHNISFIKYSGIDSLDKYYETISIIGSGSFGVVFKAKCLSDGCLWAVKKTERTKTNYIQWELHLMTIIKHKNIVSIKELIETDKYSFMVMELCSGGSLKDQFNKCGQFSETELKHIMMQFVDALRYLHNRNIAHRDLKMENLLLQSVPNPKKNTGNDNRFSNYLIKLIDFGLSVQLKMNQEMMVEYCGTPLYMPPEIIRGKSYSKQCDIWSMGIVMYTLMLGKKPFHSCENLTESILNFNINSDPLPCELGSFSEKSIEALRGLLNPDPSYRYSASELFHHSWLTGADQKESINVLLLMKQMANSKRTTNLSLKPTAALTNQ